MAYIGSFLDPDTRTTPVRIVTQNPGGILKKDMFVDAVIHTGTQGNTVVVPVSAVLRDDKNEPIVYVQTEPGKFAQRQVAIAGQQNGLDRHRQRLAGRAKPSSPMAASSSSSPAAFNKAQIE